MDAVTAWWLNAQFVFTRLPFLFRLKLFSKKLITPAIALSLETNSYEVKTADTLEEIHQVLALRFEVFFREFSTHKLSISLFPYDIDLHDFHCDHLIVKEKASGRVVACYRLQASSTAKRGERFYSEGEFDLEDFLRCSGEKVELGRACVHRDYRRGPVISLLWRGLMSYAKKSGARYLFGCSSLTRGEFTNLPHVLAWLSERGALIDDLRVSVRPEYSSEGLLIKRELSAGEALDPKAVSSLLGMYVMAGAKVGPQIAYDQEMDCLDLLTVIDLTQVPASFERRFGA